MRCKDLIFKKKGSKEPITKRAKSNYPLYKLAKDLNLDEITVLVTIRRNKIKYETDYNKILEYKEDILLLEDLYKIKRAEDISTLNRWKDEKKDILYSTCLGVRVGCIISFLGYTNSLYKEEGIKLSEKIYNKDLDEELDLIAASIVKEILDYYEALFDEKKILDIYELNECDLHKAHFLIHNWCKKNYWQK
jgi:hypothetical protein